MYLEWPRKSAKNDKSHLNVSVTWISICCLSGTKNDLDSLREVSAEEAKSFAQQQGMLSHVETSAKENNNVDDAFLSIAKVHTRLCFM